MISKSVINFASSLCLAFSMAANSAPPLDETNSESTAEFSSELTFDNQDCNATSTLAADNSGIKWLPVSITTKDSADINFDLALDIEFSAEMNDYDQAFCADLEAHIYKLLKNRIQASFIGLTYFDVSTSAPNLLKTAIQLVQSYANKELEDVNPKFSLSINGVGLKNVTAPGISPLQAKFMLAQGIRYGWDVDTDSMNERIYVFSDDTALGFDVELNYQASPKRTHELFGPDITALRISALALTDHIVQSVLRNLTEEEYLENIDHYKNVIYTKAVKIALDELGIHLLELDLNPNNNILNEVNLTEALSENGYIAGPAPQKLIF